MPSTSAPWRPTGAERRSVRRRLGRRKRRSARRRRRPSAPGGTPDAAGLHLPAGFCRSGRVRGARWVD